ncbi:MAG TPA: glycosyltransferase 87 family protein [Candidatus Limnocylindria bacterium]
MIDRTAAIRYAVVAVFVAVGLGFAAWSLTRWSVEDADAYLAAATRLLHGQELYPPALVPDPPLAYRGAPWFVAAWVPLTFLPRFVVDVAWSGVLLALSAWTVAPLIRERRLPGIALGVLCAGLLVWTSSRGNVHPLVMAALVHGAPRRSGPFWIALAASLKAAPILFVLPYVAERAWKKAILTIVLTALLVLPMPLMGWDPSRTPAGVSLAIYFQLGPPAWLATAAVAVVAAVLVAYARPRFAWIASAAAAILALPRLIFYDFTYVIVGATPAGGWRRRS